MVPLKLDIRSLYPQLDPEAGGEEKARDDRLLTRLGFQIAVVREE
jgi:hypothetical protein